MTSNRRLLNFTSARMLYLLGIIIFPFLTAHALSASQYSRFIFFSTIIATAIEIINLGIPSGIKRGLLTSADDAGAEIIAVIGKLSAKYLFISFFALLVFFAGWFAAFPSSFDSSLFFAAAVMLASFLGTGSLTLSNYIYGRERFGMYAFQEVLFSLSRLLIIPLLAYSGGLKGALAGLLIVQSLIFLTNLSAIDKGEIKTALAGFMKVPFAKIKDLLLYSWKFYLCNFCEQAYRFLAIYILAAFVSKESVEVAYLHLSFFAVSAVGMFFSSVMNSFFPALSYMRDEGDDSGFEKLSFLIKKYLIFISGGVMLFVLCFADDLIKLLPKDYINLSGHIKIFIFASCFRGITVALSYQSLAAKTMRGYIKANFIWMGIYVAAFVIGGYYYKGLGILIAALLSEGIYAAVFVFIAERKNLAKYIAMIASVCAATFFAAKILSCLTLPAEILAFAASCGAALLLLYFTGIINKKETLLLIKAASAQKRESKNNRLC